LIRISKQLIKEQTKILLCPPKKVYTGQPVPFDLIQKTESESQDCFNGPPPNQRLGFDVLLADSAHERPAPHD
jgi:hypothetical protein